MKAFKRFKDVIAGAVLLLISAIYFSGSFFKTSLIMKAKYGPGFMPKIYAVLLACLSIALIISGWKTAKTNTAKEETEEADVKSLIAVVLTIVFLAVYLILIEIIGFLAASAVYLFAQAWLLAKKKNYLVLTLFSVITALLIYLLFVKVLGLTLPTGILKY